ncbi:MAG: glycosyltransferase family 2 protein [Rubrivivax sp.]|nr:MAG: glycosyltransferase family 2 protein [Rubrivivax sp.]
MMAPQVAVVIPTYRRPDLLMRCLDAVVAQKLPPEAFEVIVVDDGQGEDIREIVESLASRTGGLPLVRYLRPEGTRGPAGARNRGWRASHAPVIAFTDDDTIPHQDWLAQGLKALADRKVAVCGRVVVPITQAPTDHERNTQGLETAEFVTANAFVRRDALVDVGGFDERFKRAWREDSDLQFALMKLGEVGKAPDAAVTHPVRSAPWGVSMQQQANAFFDALLYKKYPRLYRTRIHPQPPWRYYFVVLCTVLALASAATGHGLYALAFLAAALVAIAGFIFKRLEGASHSPSHVAEMVITSLAIPYLSIYWRLLGAARFRVLFI